MPDSDLGAVADWILRIDPAAARPIHIEGGPRAPQIETRGELLLAFDGVLHPDPGLASQLGLDANPGLADLLATGLGRFGTDFFVRLRGEFALAVFDARTCSVLVARDIVGVVSVYYATVAGSLFVSPSIDALLATDNISREVSRVALADFIWDRLPPLDETSYTAIKRLPAASVLKWSPTGANVSFYWPSGPADIPARGSEVHQLGALLEQAAGRCRRGAEAAVLLSGGTDSAVVAAAATSAARRAGDSTPIAVSLLAETRPYREDELQRWFAQELGLEHVLVDLEQLLASDGFVKRVVALAEQMPRPISNPFLPVHLELLRQARTRNCQVVLDGGGGDELLGIDLSNAARFFRSGDLPGLYRFWRLRRRWNGSPMIRSTFWTQGLRPLLLPHTGPTESPPAWLAPGPGLAAALRERQADRRRVTNDPYLPTRDRVVALEHEGEFAEQGRTGTRIRHPIRDPDVVAFLAELPADTLSLGGSMKGLARAYLAGELPESGSLRLRRVTAGYVWRTFFDRHGSQLLEHVGELSALAEAEVVDRQALQPHGGDAISLRQLVGDASFWNLLSAELWLRKRT